MRDAGATTWGEDLAREACRRGLLPADRLRRVLTELEAVAPGERDAALLVISRAGGVPERELQALAAQARTVSPGEAALRGFPVLGPRYQVVRELGSGGMGSVYLCTDLQLRRPVAVKVLRPDPQAGLNERALARFAREGQLMARVQHPVCVAVFDVGRTSEGAPFLAMEYVEGETLRGRLKREGPQPVERVLAWGVLLAEALADCHRHGVVHRDVKPENVLLDAQGQVRLMDFGVALDEASATRMTADQGIVGTPGYMAPEQAACRPVGPPADVYALGLTLYELLVGTIPFQARSLLAMVREILEVQPAPLRSARPDAPAWLEDVLARCLAKAAGERFASAEELARALRGPSASPGRGAGTGPGGRARALLILGLSLAACAGILLTGARLRASPEQRSAEEPPAVASTAEPSPAPRLEVREGRTFNGLDGSELVWIPAGTFVMGNPRARPGAPEQDEGPAHRVTLSRGYYLGKFEVTRAQYRRFCEASGRTVPPPPGPDVTDDHPIVGVTWSDAAAYCAWAGGRLPTEAEWEYAARGTDGRLHPWGNRFPRPDEGLAPTANVGDLAYAARNHGYQPDGPYDDGWELTAPAGSFPLGASPFGCLDMAGNAIEWVADWFAPYPEAELTDPQGPPRGEMKILRGGGYGESVWVSRSCHRAPVDPEVLGTSDTGFRLCVDDAR